MKLLLLAGFGGFLGAVGRYLIGLFFSSRDITGFPYATLVVNLLGCFAIGILFGLWQKGDLSEEWKTFSIIGVLGGFTTFSAFSNECLQLISSGSYVLAFTYILSSLILGILLTFAGIQLVK